VVRRVGLKGGDFKPLPRPTPPPPPPPRASIALGKPRVPRGKPLPREFLFDIAKAIQAAVEPLIRSAKGREVVGTATSGDATFQLDKIAEKALLTFLRDARKPVAYYSEDSGYTTFTSGQPQHLLVVDPIDGTRAAKSGFEGCVVSIASTRVIERPRMVDVDNACVAEILTPRMFYAERGKGTRIYQDGSVKKPRLSKNANLETVVWAMTVPARPAELTFPTAAKLIDLTSLKGGFFACNSTSYSLTRLVTCQYDACVDFANRFLRDIPQMVEDQFINAGRGVVLGIAPYDLAASLLVAREAGCSVTDAYGHSFDEVLLLDSSVGNHRSMIAAANKELHEKLMSFFDTRIRQFEQLLQRRVRTE
jgi:myo-inositol-1(or 4)-monophosphatase